MLDLKLHINITKKLETNYIAQGKAEVWLENDDGVVEKFIMNEGDSFTVTPKNIGLLQFPMLFYKKYQHQKSMM